MSRWKPSLPPATVRYRRDKVLWVCNSGDGLMVAHKMLLEGTQVFKYVHSPQFAHVYDGLIPAVELSELPQFMKQTSDVIFGITRKNWRTPADLGLLKAFGCKADSNGVFGPVADVMREQARVIGCTEWTENLEMDRKFGSEIAKKIGLTIPETHEFVNSSKAKNIAAGIEFLRANQDKLWVFKPNGNEDLALTYVENRPGELLTKLEEPTDIPERLASKDGSFIIQLKVKGIELSTEAWKTGSGKLVSWNHTVENKKLMDGNLGPNVGSASNLVWQKTALRGGYLVAEMTRLLPYLKGYEGPLDWNTIIDEVTHEPNHLEPTFRPGYDALEGLLALQKNRRSDFMLGNFEADWERGFAATERVSIPPYPEDNEESMKKAKDVVFNVDLSQPWFWGDDVYMKNNRIRCAGTNAVVGIVTATGKTPEIAYAEVQEKIKSLDVGAELQHRTDLMERTSRDLKKLAEWEIITW